ncbi:MAG: hypothetical protein WC565_10030 [Parcubacteria group bacterium]|jgi:hypothetical protein
MKTYKPNVFISDVSPFDAMYSDVKSGAVVPGEKVRYWDDESCRYVIATVGLYFGEPSVSFITPRQHRRRTN